MASKTNLTATEWLGVSAVGLVLAYGAHRILGPGATGDKKTDAAMLAAGAAVYVVGVGFGAKVPKAQLGAATASGALLFAAGAGIGSTRPDDGWVKAGKGEKVLLDVPTDQELLDAIPSDQEVFEAIPTDQDIEEFVESGRASEPELSGLGDFSVDLSGDLGGLDQDLAPHQREM